MPCDRTDRETGYNGLDLGFYAPGYCACAPLYSSDGEGDDVLTDYTDTLANRFADITYALGQLKKSMFGSNHRVLFSNGMLHAGAVGGSAWKSGSNDGVPMTYGIDRTTTRFGKRETFRPINATRY